MHPLLAAPRRLAWYALAWVLAGAGLAVTLRLSGQAATLAGALVFALPVCLAYAFVALSSYHVCRSLPVATRRWSTAIALYGGASLLSALAWLGAGEAWDALGRLVLGEPLVALSPPGWILYFAAGFLLYLLALFAHDALVAFENLQAAALREAESRTLAREAELRLLRTQIEPHFLFNSLNSISALTAIDPAAAREMTVDLAQFFRRTLALAGRERIALGEEVELCRHYLAIEQRRFGRKLRAELRVDDAAADCLLPPMTLQPLLENAVKHGIRGLDEGGTIEVDAAVRDGWLHLAVANPVAGEAPAGQGSGVGLVNLRERLAVLYGPRGRLDWHRTPERFEIALALPAQRIESKESAT